ncbi:MAG: sporulation protein YabP [Oscillospiraceae bacterium]|nr:sporulation protein YabP [Oscillospiraceae bacterium]
MTFEDNYRIAEKPQNLVLEGRKKLSVTGVRDIESFDENTVTLMTSLGDLQVRGQGLKLEKLSVENGEAAVSGDIDSLEYFNQSMGGRGFFSRLMGR